MYHRATGARIQALADFSLSVEVGPGEVEAVDMGGNDGEEEEGGIDGWLVRVEPGETM